MAETIKTELWLPTNETATVELDREFHILPNFRLWELANNLAEEEVKMKVPDARAWKLLNMLQITRNKWGSMNINSCFRTPTFNSTLEGASSNSAHLRTWAFDWACPNQSYNQQSDKIAWWKSLCEVFAEIGAIGIYSWGYHCEIGSDILYGQKEFQVRRY